MFDGIFAQLGLKVVQVEPFITHIYGPVRKHKKSRIQKKWLKKYGKKIIDTKYDFYLGDRIFIDHYRGIAYCHPHIYNQLKQNERWS